MTNQQSKNNSTNNTQTEDLQGILLSIPSNVSDWLYSVRASENTQEIGKNFNFTPERNSMLAKITGRVAIKNIAIVNMISALEKYLGVNREIATKIAIETAIKQFLPLRDYMPETEGFIKSLGGQLPNPLPPIMKVKEGVHPQQTASSAPAPDTIIKKDIMSVISDKVEVANQAVTKEPIKFSDSENLRLPTIKNWLLDYKKYRNSFPSQELALIRARYINDAPNTKTLNQQEKKIISELIRSYDEHTLLPFSQKSGLLMLELMIETPSQLSTSQPPQITPSQPVAPQFHPQITSQSFPKKDTFREQVSEEDLAGPQAARKPAPRLDGNVVDLKDFSGQ